MSVTVEHLLEWKREFGEVYQMTILEDTYFFRSLGREEYKEVILLDLDLGEFQEAICFQAILHPADYNFSEGIAGIAEILSDGVLDASGLHLGQAKELLDQYRAEMFNYDYQVDCLIHEAFPEYTLEEIATWPIRRTMFYLSRSEWILENLKGVRVQPIDAMIQQDFDMQPQEQLQPTPPPAPKEPELATGETRGMDFMQEKPPQQQVQKAAGEMTEEEVMAMLSQNGAKITKPVTSMNDVMPELGWFSYMDELKGDFD